nr:unnamed protein product [Callosobruchus chinensis]
MAGKITAYTGAPSLQTRAATVRPALQQYEPRRSPPLAIPRQQEQQQRYFSPERQGKMSDRWAEEVTQRRAYDKANESRYQSPNMHQYLYTSTN